MKDAEPGSRLTRIRSGRRSRRRIVMGITAGIMVGGGLVVATTGTAGASVNLLRSIDTAKKVSSTTAAAAGTGASAATSASPSASPSASASASAGSSDSTTRSASKAATTKAASSAATASASATKSTAAAPITTTGQSVTLTSDEQPSQVGAIFSGSISDGHTCTASVVDSPAGDLIVTAAHCLSSGSSTATFVPGYHDGTAPYGEWKITDVIESSAWTDNQSEDDDVAFAVVQPLNGKSLQSVVGAYSLDTSGVTDTTVQITGYPSDTDEPITGTCLSTAFSSTQLQVACTGYPGGTSGSGWLENYDASTGSGTLIGVIGGYQEGGDTDDVSYAALFDDSVQSLYQQAVTAAANG
ncbi:serine protease [Streptacidiphilus sp. N1-10]|uniref:Serine protease n=1 Tax=Streptacidiphilus jeojiensis TaxID=3229225 RepID=A0ABV6XRN6_9ACTN